MSCFKLVAGKKPCHWSCSKVISVPLAEITSPQGFVLSSMVSTLPWVAVTNRPSRLPASPGAPISFPTVSNLSAQGVVAGEGDGHQGLAGGSHLRRTDAGETPEQHDGQRRGEQLSHGLFLFVGRRRQSNLPPLQFTAKFPRPPQWVEAYPLKTLYPNHLVVVRSPMG